MRRSYPDSPAKLVLLAITGAAMVAILFLAIGHANSYDLHRTTLFFIAFAVFLGGASLSLISTSALRRGIDNHRWSDSQLEALRGYFESRACKASSIALFIAFALLAIPFKRFRAEGWVCFVFLQTISQIRLALRRPPIPAPPPEPPIFAALHSDHWGRR